jgi:hypothetical protein
MKFGFSKTGAWRTVHFDLTRPVRGLPTSHGVGSKVAKQDRVGA